MAGKVKINKMEVTSASTSKSWRTSKFLASYPALKNKIMNAVNALRFLKKPFLTKVKTVVWPLKNFQRNYFKPKQPSSFDMRAQTKNDVVLFKLENKKFFIAINILATLQCVIWTYLGMFLFRSLDTPVFNFKGNKFWEKVIEKEREYSSMLCLASIFFGWTAFVATVSYSMRSIRKIILHKDARFVTIVTYNLPGYNTVKIPLNNISAMEQRKKAKKFIPLKLKNTYFYYLIDVSGEFNNTELFDYTVGMRRGF